MGLILYMALAAGESLVKTGPLTLHCETAIHIAEKLTNAKFTVSDDPHSSGWIIKCQGIGLINPFLKEDYQVPRLLIVFLDNQVLEDCQVQVYGPQWPSFGFSSDMCI